MYHQFIDEIQSRFAVRTFGLTHQASLSSLTVREAMAYL